MTRTVKPEGTRSYIVAFLFAEAKKQGIRTKTIAFATGVQAPAVSAWKTGRTSPSIKVIEKFSALLGYEFVLWPAND